MFGNWINVRDTPPPVDRATMVRDGDGRIGVAIRDECHLYHDLYGNELCGAVQWRPLTATEVSEEASLALERHEEVLAALGITK